MPNITFQQFLYAIAGQESGGNYRAVNARTGALGKYQILPSNIGPWSRQYLGYTITPQQFLNSPTLQERLAQAVLRHYFNAYGPRGAAAAWYSGSPKNANNYKRFRANEPSIGEYVDSVLSRAKGAPGGQNVQYSRNVIGPKFGEQPHIKAAIGQDVEDKFQGQTGTAKSALDAADSPPGLEAQDNSGVGLEAADASRGVGMDLGLTGNRIGVGTDQQQQAGAPMALQDTAEQRKLGQQLGGFSTGLRRAAVLKAMEYIGTPYVWGGSAPGGFDCSGLIQYALKSIGISIPRVSWDQLAVGKRVPISQLEPGDLVGFGNGSHVAMYIGGGMIVEAPRRGLDVRTRKLGKGENVWGVSLANLYR